MLVLYAVDFCVQLLRSCLHLPLCSDFATLVCYADPAARLCLTTWSALLSQGPLAVACGTHSGDHVYLGSLDTPQLLDKQGFWAFITPSVTWTLPDQLIVDIVKTCRMKGN